MSRKWYASFPFYDRQSRAHIIMVSAPLNIVDDLEYELYGLIRRSPHSFTVRRWCGPEAVWQETQTLLKDWQA